MMNAELGFGRKVLESLEDCDISFEHLPSGIDTMSVIVSTAQLEGHRERVLQAMTRRTKPEYIPCDIKTGSGKNCHSPINCEPKGID